MSTIICLHGYGKRRSLQYAALVETLQDKYDFVCPDYYTLDPDDIDHQLWISRVEEIVKQHCTEDIIMIGFSLGAVIASYMATRYSIKKLIFLGASFEYEHFLEVKRANPDPQIPEAYLKTFVEICDNFTPCLKDVECPISFIHALQDEIIPYELSIKYHDLAKSKHKNLYLLGGGRHMLFDDDRLRDKVIDIIETEIKSI